MTAHKFLYYSTKLPNGKFAFKPKSTHQIGLYKLIVVDEISMLDKELWNLLLSHKIHVIACGDPFQIPPIRKDQDNGVLANPHIFLDEIVRQAAESEIIQLSMDIRNFKPINYFKGSEVQVIKPEELVDGMYFWADQIITATNAKKDQINRFMRAAQGMDEEPQIDDKLICAQNRWEISDLIGNASLVNGTIGKIEDLEKRELQFPFVLNYKKVNALEIDLGTPEDELFSNLIIDYDYLKTGKSSLTSQEEYKLYKMYKELIPVKFDYGYAITGHRAQGSQWDKVLVFEERFPFDKIEHARWLYTCCTRPTSKLVLVR